MDSPELDDSALLRRARGDAEAFGAFYRRHARAVYRSLLGACGDPDVALDLTAETFARALQRSVLRLRIASRLGCSRPRRASRRRAACAG